MHGWMDTQRGLILSGPLLELKWYSGQQSSTTLWLHAVIAAQRPWADLSSWPESSELWALNSKTCGQNMWLFDYLLAACWSKICPGTNLCHWFQELWLMKAGERMRSNAVNMLLLRSFYLLAISCNYRFIPASSGSVQRFIAAPWWRRLLVLERVLPLYSVSWKPLETKHISVKMNYSSARIPALISP